MTNPTSNYGFVLPTSTDLVTDLPADFEVALQGVDTRLKALQPGTTLGDIAYSSATANTNTRLPIGTSGQVLAVSGAGVPEWTTTADVTPLTTKGDLFTYTTADARLGVGTDGQTLVADSSTATGLKWATPAGGASGYTFISRSTFSGVATADIDNVFTSTYETYQIVIEECFSTVDSDLQLQWRYAGPNTQTASYYGKLASLSTTYSAIDISNAAQASINENIRTTTGQASNGSFYVNQVGNGSRNPIAYGVGAACSVIMPTAFNSFCAQARAYTGFRLFAASGNLTANVTVYGLAKS